MIRCGPEPITSFWFATVINQVPRVMRLFDGKRACAYSWVASLLASGYFQTNRSGHHSIDCDRFNCSFFHSVSICPGARHALLDQPSCSAHWSCVVALAARELADAVLLCTPGSCLRGSWQRTPALLGPANALLRLQLGTTTEVGRN